MTQPTLVQQQRVIRLMEHNPSCKFIAANRLAPPGEVRLRVRHKNGTSFKNIRPDGSMYDTTPQHYLRSRST